MKKPKIEDLIDRAIPLRGPEIGRLMSRDAILSRKYVRRLSASTGLPTVWKLSTQQITIIRRTVRLGRFMPQESLQGL